MTKFAARVISSTDIDQREPPWHPDCACETSNVALTAGGPAVLPLGARPRLCPDLYQDAATLPTGRIVYNPIAGHGVSVLDLPAARVFDLVDGRQDVGTIAAQLGADAATIQTTLDRLLAARLIYVGEQPPRPTPRPPTHLGVWLHVTNQCNLRCTYCYLGKTNEQLPVALGRRALRAVFEAAGPQGVRDLTLKYAGGEALLEAETIWALDAYAREQAAATGITVQSTILTNGTPLRPALAATLQERGFHLAISLDGLGRAHDAQRPLLGGQPSFALVQRGIETARTAGLALSISVVVGPGNLTALPTLIDYLLDRDLPFSLTFLRDNTQAHAGLAEQPATLIAAMDAAYDRIAARPPRFSLMNAALDRVQLEQPHFAACGIGESYVVIKHTGEVTSCQMLLDRPVGHLREGNVLHLIAQRTRERPHGTTIDDHAGCSTCTWRYRCAGGCPVVTFATTGRFDQPSPFCGVYKALIPRLVALEGLRIARYGGLAVTGL